MSALLALLGCSPAGSGSSAAQDGRYPADAPPLVVQQARLEAAPLLLLADRASLDEAGRGQASGVRARVESPARPPLVIEAPDSTWDLRTRTVRFSGGVRAWRGEVLLECEELQVVYAGPDEVESALALGDVRLRHGGRAAQGERAELLARDGSLVLTGSPRLQDGANELVGRAITFYLDDDRVRCQDCRLSIQGSALGPR